MAWARALFVHLFTATGAGLGFLALLLATGGQWSRMFFVLGLALLVDGLDGPLARLWKAEEVLPRWSGEILDLVIDFVTYVFVPAYAITASGLLPPAVAIPIGVLVVVSAALYFADRKMKTEDYYFRGFPCVWNVAAFYLFLLQPAAWAAVVIVVLLSALSFVPFAVLHPLRVERLRALHVALLAAWAVLAVLAVVEDLQPGPLVIWLLVAIAGYFFVAGFLPRRHGPRASPV